MKHVKYPVQGFTGAARITSAEFGVTGMAGEAKKHVWQILFCAEIKEADFG